MKQQPETACRFMYGQRGYAWLVQYIEPGRLRMRERARQLLRETRRFP
jgi:hypothetical protein